MPTHRCATRYGVLFCCAIIAWACSACAGLAWAQTLDIPAAAIPSEPLLGTPAASPDVRATGQPFPPGDIPAALPTQVPERGGNLIQSTFSPETAVQRQPETTGQAEPAAEVVWDEWRWQFLPDGLMYPAYLAGGREPRFASLWVYRRGDGWLWDSALGGQVGLIRYGSEDGPWPEGWQIDFAGAAFTRQDMERDLDVREVDYRLAVPLTYRRGIFEFKFGYYHVCSHLADEYMILNPDSLNTRINYVRNGLMLGVAVRPWRPLRLYTEIGYSVHTDGGAEPWEFQALLKARPAGGDAQAPFQARPVEVPDQDPFFQKAAEDVIGGKGGAEKKKICRARKNRHSRQGSQLFCQLLPGLYNPPDHPGELLPVGKSGARGHLRKSAQVEGLLYA